MNKPQKTKTLRALQAGLLASTMLAVPAFGARLAYDGFNYTLANNAVISGAPAAGAGTLGFNAAFVSGNVNFVTAGLSYTGIAPVLGGAIRFDANDTLTARPWGNTTTFPADGTYWYSFLIKPESGARGTLNILSSTNSTNGQDGFGMRLDNNTGNGSGTDLLFKALSPASGGPSSSPITVTGGYGTTHLIVGRVDFNTTSGSTNRIWVNPNLALGAPSDASSVSISIDATVSQTARPSLVGRMFGGVSAPSALTYDEVRIGNIFDEVFPPATLALSPNTGVEGQDLTFTWENIPASVTAMELDPGNIPLTPSASGTYGPIPAPAANETYTLTYTVGGIDSTLTQNFTAIPPTFTLTPSLAYPGQTLTFNWRLPIGSDPIAIDNSVGPISIDATGAGTTSLPAPIANTTYTLTYTFNSTVFTLTQNFTLGAPFVDVSPAQAVEDTTPLVITWRVPVGVTAVTLKSGPTSGPYSSPVDVLTTFTNAATGAGALTPNPTPALTTTEYVLEYTLDSINYTVADTLEVFPKIFQSVVATGTAPGNVIVNPAPMNNGVLAYSDRGHVWAAVPTVLQGAQFVKFAQNDKENAALSVQFTAAKKATFFLLIDNRIGDGVGGTNPAAGTDDPPDFDFGAMPWVLSSGFVDSGVDIGLDENPSGATTIDQSYSVYFRQVEAGEVFTFLAQNDGSQRNMYGIAGVAPQVVPVTFFANPAAINSIQFSSTQLNWTVPAGATAVDIVPSIGSSISVLGDTDSGTGVGSTSVSPTVTTTYTLTYDPAGASPPVSLAPVTVYVNELTASPAEYAVGGSTTLSWKIPPGSTNVLINQGVGNVTGDTNGAGVGFKGEVAAGVGFPSYTLTYIAPGATTATEVGPVRVTVNNTPFGQWMADNYSGITAPNNTAAADPDGDGISNFGEFAFAGNPGSGSENGVTRSAIESVSGDNYLTMTFACRFDVVFSGSGPVTGSIEGVDYSVRASADLSAFTLGLAEVVPAILGDLPETAPDGYEYRTFRVTGAQSATPKAFIQAVAAPTP